MRSRAKTPNELLSILALLFALGGCNGPGANETPPAFIKGMTVSAQTWGWECATPEMARTLDELKSLGVNSIAIHPYAQIENNGHVRFRAVEQNHHISVPLDWARQRGLSVMLIPHIAYWGSKFLWRGEINFQTAAEWDRFFN